MRDYKHVSNFVWNLSEQKVLSVSPYVLGDSQLVGLSPWSYSCCSLQLEMSLWT